MKYKVGDKVRVREDLKVGDGFGCTTAVVDMLKYRGKIMTIKEARSSAARNYTIYEIDDDGGSWLWTDEMLEPAYADGGVVSIHDLPTSEWYNPIRIDLPEFVFDAEQAKELAERLNKELAGHFNAFPNDGISAKMEVKIQ